MRLLPVKLESGGRMPTKGTEGSAGYDLYSPESGYVYPDCVSVIPLNIRLAIPDGYCGIITHRSGANTHGVCAYGTIDSDYRGVLKVTIVNSGAKIFRYSTGDRIAQIRFVEVPNMNLMEVSKLSSTERGEGGHGSTGV